MYRGNASWYGFYEAGGVAVHPTDPDQVYLSTPDVGVLVTRDGGATWGAQGSGGPAGCGSSACEDVSPPVELTVIGQRLFTRDVESGTVSSVSLDGGVWAPAAAIAGLPIQQLDPGGYVTTGQAIYALAASCLPSR